MEGCTLCPRMCGVDRNKTAGYCGSGSLAKAARAAKHLWEEPCISGTEGSGTVFFSGCTLGCVFCQNREISRGGVGKELTPEQLADAFRRLETQGVHNLNLVTPTHFTPQILQALELAQPGIPVVMNCGGYERVETLQKLEGLVDIYLPDLKYADDPLAKALSGVQDYFSVATAAIREMVRQTGPVQWAGEKVRKGVIVRHLILPGYVENSLKVLDWLGENFAPGEILVSLMRQYTPVGKQLPPLDRRVTDEEYDAVLSWMFLNDLEGFTQDAEAAEESFIPDFQQENN